MRESDSETAALTPEESWRDIHETMNRARSSMYVAGTPAIMLLWAAIATLGVGSQYAILTLASEFAERSPWIFGALWGVLMAPGMVGSGIIGRRAGRKIAPGDAARSAGIRVFLYWLAVVVAIFLIPVAAGMWNAENGDKIPGVVLGIVSLAYILFGIMHRPVIATVGVGFAAAFYIPNYLVSGDAAMLVSAALMLSVVALGAVVDTQERRPMTEEAIVLNETIHQSTRLQIMTLLVSMPETDRLAYGFIQKTLGLTGGNLTTHLRKLEDADYLVTAKEFQDSKPHTWIQATPTGRQAFAEYLSNLEKALNWHPVSASRKQSPSPR